MLSRAPFTERKYTRSALDHNNTTKCICTCIDVNTYTHGTVCRALQEPQPHVKQLQSGAP